MFVFDVTTKAGAQGRIQVQALDWSQSGPVSFQCDSDELALVLLSGCRCDAVGYFNLLGGCKPLYVEQWLTYLQERGQLEKVTARQESPSQPDYLTRAGRRTTSSMPCSARSTRWPGSTACRSTATSSIATTRPCWRPVTIRRSWSAIASSMTSF